MVLVAIFTGTQRSGNYGRAGNGIVLREGMVIAIEPMIAMSAYDRFLKMDGPLLPMMGCHQHIMRTRSLMPMVPLSFQKMKLVHGAEMQGGLEQHIHCSSRYLIVLKKRDRQVAHFIVLITAVDVRG